MMMQNDPIIDGAKRLFKSIDSDPEIRGILLTHSCISAALAWIPLPTASTAVYMVNVYAMYGRINAALGVPFSKNVVKSIAGMIASNLSGIATRALGIAFSEALKFIPGIGSIAGGVLETTILYSLTGVQGKIYCEWLRLMIMKGAIARDGTFDGTSARSALDEILADKKRIKDMLNELKKEAGKADFKKYRDEAAAVLKRYMEENKKDDDKQ